VQVATKQHQDFFSNLSRLRSLRFFRLAGQSLRNRRALHTAPHQGSSSNFQRQETLVGASCLSVANLQKIANKKSLKKA